MSQQVELLSISRDFENLLTEIYAATGQGLHQKVNSVEEKLPPELVKKLRFIASVRNKVVHQGDVDETTIGNIRIRSAEAMHYIESCRPAKVAAHNNSMLGLLLVVIAVALAIHFSR